MENNNVCQFCNKRFSTKSILISHQKTAKYCLEKQGLNNEEFKCSYCYKILATQLRLNTHIKICKIKIENDTKEEIDELAKYKNLTKSNEKDIKNINY